ncbi:MAG: nucleotidyl transferase, partial [Chloroflexi bacterium]|nr:nucleotidyl transferase [Chloroflexota bacterium]
FALDIDRPWDILAANYIWLGFLGQTLSTDIIHPSARISDRAGIKGHVVLGENAVIGPGVVIEGNAWIDKDALVTNGAIIGANTYIGPRTQVKDYALLGEHTSIGPRCKIGYCAEIHGVLFGRSTVMHQCELWGVLGEAVDIGAGTMFGTLRFDDQPQPHRIKGRWETPPYASCATFIGDFCRTGVSTIFMPGSKVGAYSAIGPGVMVSGDIPENSLLLLKQEVEHKEWGPAKYGW